MKALNSQVDVIGYIDGSILVFFVLFAQELVLFLLGQVPHGHAQKVVVILRMKRKKAILISILVALHPFYKKILLRASRPPQGQRRCLRSR